MMMNQEDIFQFKRPGVAVDVVLLAILDDELKVALIKREDEPYFGKFALPGRFVRYEEKVEETARKALETKGNIDAGSIFLEQLYTFGDNLERDTRIRTISIVYYALIGSEAVTSQRQNKFSWQPVLRLPPLAFDHKTIIEYSIGRMRAKLFRSDVVFGLLPKEFTLTQLQQACELVLGQPLDKRNFRKKAVELWVLRDARKTQMDGAHRPAALYSYVRMQE